MSNEVRLFGILGQWKGSDGVLRTQEIIGVQRPTMQRFSAYFSLSIDG